LTLAEGSLDVADIAGKAAQAEIGGHLKVGLARPFALSGALDVGEINLSALIAAAIGTPVHSGPAVVWPAEPFEQGLLGNFSGKIEVKSAYVALTPRLAVKNVRSVVRLDPGELAFEEIDGTMAGGRLGGELYLRRGADGVTAHSRLSFAGADVAELIRGGPPPLSGHVTGEIDVQGAGRSPIALIGSLKGSGSFTLQDGQIQRLDPGAFEPGRGRVDQGLPIDSVRIRDRMEQGLAAGALPVTLAEGQIAIADGQVWLAKTMVRAQGADLTLGGNVVLT